MNAGETLVPMTTSERRSVTKVFGETTPQKQYLIQRKGATLCLGEDAYLHRESPKTNGEYDYQESKTFENSGLSSFVDNEMRRLHDSRFLNTKLSSKDGGGIRKWEKVDNGGFVGTHRRGTLGNGEVTRDKGICEVKGVVVKNNNEKLGKYSRRPRNISK